MILITGAATRIGALVARRIVQRAGQRLILHYHQSADAAAALAAELRGQGSEVVLWQQDLRAADVGGKFRDIIAAHGPLDVLVNNAAVFNPKKDRVGDITPELYEEITAINLRAPMMLMQEFARQDINAGNIINILDQRVLNISHAFPVYTASKSALGALTLNMAKALAPRIRVNAIAPGHVLPTEGEDEAAFHARRAKTPLGTGPSPDDIAAAVEFILNSPSMTGACIPLDGGEHLVPKTK